MAFSQQRRPLRFAGCIAALLLSGALVQSPFGRAIYADRTFFGVYRVRVDDRLNYRFMFHGPTLHGMQSTAEGRRSASLSYFHKDGPIGQVFAAVAAGRRNRRGRGRRPRCRIAGQLRRDRRSAGRSTRSTPRSRTSPATRRSSPTCATAAARCEVVIGDARVSLGRARPQQFGVLILDAFSSDAIPVHLLTREALSLYLSRLAPGGLIALHISNLHLSLSPVLGRLAEDQGLVALWQREPATAGSLTDGKFPSEWMVIARTAPISVLWPPTRAGSRRSSPRRRRSGPTTSPTSSASCANPRLVPLRVQTSVSGACAFRAGPRTPTDLQNARDVSEVRASHATGPPSREALRRGLAVALAEAEASRRSGERESVSGSPRGEAPRIKLDTGGA